MEKDKITNPVLTDAQKKAMRWQANPFLAGLPPKTAEDYDKKVRERRDLLEFYRLLQAASQKTGIVIVPVVSTAGSLVQPSTLEIGEKEAQANAYLIGGYEATKRKIENAIKAGDEFEKELADAE